MNKESLSIALVGSGYWGKNLARNFAELGALDAIVDDHRDTAERIAGATGARIATLDEVLADPAIDGVSFATPAETHAALALRALESFARLGTVWQAADELHITRSAVSHQLRLLERDLGFRLMNRVGTRAELTPQGKAYAEDVRDGADTVLKLEALRHKRRHLPPKQKPADFTFTRKGAGQ